MLRELWRTITLFAFASDLRRDGQGQVYLLKYPWIGTTARKAWRLSDEGVVLGADAKTSAAILVLPFVAAGIAVASAHTLNWLIVTCMVLFLVCWITYDPLRPIKRNATLVEIDGWPSNGIGREILGLQYFELAGRLLQALTVIGAAGYITVSAFYEQIPDTPIRTLLRLLAAAAALLPMSAVRGYSALRSAKTPASAHGGSLPHS